VLILTRYHFDYAKGNECKYIYSKKSGNCNLKTKGPVPGGQIILKDRLRLVSQIKKQMSHGGSMDSCSLNFKASSSVVNALQNKMQKN
jgi:hypothetical protein